MPWRYHCHTVRKEWAVFDEEMRLVIPVYQFLLELKKRAYAQNTLRAYAVDLMEFHEFLQYQEIELANVELTDILDFRTWRLLPKDVRKQNGIFINEGAEIAPKTWGRQVSAIAKYFKVLKKTLKHELKISAEDIRGEDGDRRRDSRRKKGSSEVGIMDYEKLKSYIEREELIALTDNLNSRDKIIVELMYYTGLRIGEVFSITRKQFKAHRALNGTVALMLERSSSFERDRQTKSGGRVVFLPEATYNRVVQHFTFKSRPNGHQYLFSTIRNSRNSKIGDKLSTSTFRENFKLACKKAGVGFVPHDLRHTFITNGYRAGGDLKFMQMIAGHRSIETTGGYTHLDDKEMLRRVGLIQNKLYKAMWDK